MPISNDTAPLAQFLAGQAVRAQEFLGSHPTVRGGQSGWLFRVWAPHAQAVAVMGDFNGWDDRANPMAALEGFRDVDRTRILVFYPKDGVSAIQELQMVTQEGKNVGVCSVFGNFDDAQTGVKKLFSDEALRQELARRGYFLSSANSINWGRVLPQIVYYISAYCDLLRDEKIQPDQAVNVCVPTGNFGNILAAYYAREMGVPIDRLICASNSNNVLTEFIRTGRYDRNRAFHNTISPSMDILISSNLERLLLALTQDDEQVKDYMAQLSATGTYQVSDRVREKLQKRFAGYFCDDAETKAVIGRIYQKYDYLIDPHTAVAFDALEQYRSETGDQTPCIVVSTASPFKFCDSVLSALGEEEKQNGLELLDELSEKTGMPAPKPLASLRDASHRPWKRTTWWTRCWGCWSKRWPCTPLEIPTCPSAPTSPWMSSAADGRDMWRSCGRDCPCWSPGTPWCSAGICPGA